MVLNIIKALEIILRKFKKVEFPRFDAYYDSVMKHFFWNEAIRLLLESYLEMPIVALIVLKKFDFDKFGSSYTETISQCSLFFFVTTTLSAPFVIFIYLYEYGP